jgi:hypothetical protein
MPDWQSELSEFFEAKDKPTKSSQPEAEDAWAISSAFFSGTVMPAFQEIEYEMEKYDRNAMVWGSADMAYIDISHEGERELKYVIRTDLPDLRPFTEIHYMDPESGKTLISKGIFRISKKDYSMEDIDQDVIIHDFLAEYYAHHS